jgi:hypothetical protein
VFIVVYFGIDSVRKLLDTDPYNSHSSKIVEHMATHPTGVLTTDGHALEVRYKVVFLYFEGMFPLVRDRSYRWIVMAATFLEVLDHPAAQSTSS